MTSRESSQRSGGVNRLAAFGRDKRSRGLSTETSGRGSCSRRGRERKRKKEREREREREGTGFLFERRRVASTSGRGNYFNVGRVARGIQCVGGPARSSLRPRNFDPRRGSLHRPRRSVEGNRHIRTPCMHMHRRASTRTVSCALYIDARYYAHRPRVHPFDDHKPRLGVPR